ncbi:MAG: c-type cytochrome biogenesis protein CcmI [Rhodobacteraceae bacterium]|nr:c-type cytochrome biogenesis protein CcmI [Paracoccaceae bacterium]
MTLWLALLAMTAIAAIAVALPFLRRPAKTDGKVAGIEVFREQARQLERDSADGVISAEDADATRREIERRTIAAARRSEGEGMRDLGEKPRVVIAAVTVGWVVVGGALLYGTTGRPELAGRGAPHGTIPMPQLALTPPTGSMAPPRGAATAVPQAAPLADVDTMIARLVERLTADPGNLDGWKMLGWSYSGTGRYGEAAEAYTRAAELAPADAEILSLRAEALVRADGDRVTDRALSAIDETLAVDPKNPRARYYQGIALDQAGDAAGAVGLWLDILAGAPPDAPWAGDLRARIQERAPAAGIDLTGRPGFAAPVSPGPTAADVAAAQDMSASDRQAMIRGMVDGLAARLADAPDDLEGWHRLIRARVVLGDVAEAQAALDTARQTFAGNAGALARLDAAAREMNLR